MGKQLKKYHFYSDSGHGWLAVKIKELVRLNLMDKISSYSYIKGKTVYLEEDCDASMFIQAKKLINEKVEIKTTNYNRAPIRSYKAFYA